MYLSIHMMVTRLNIIQTHIRNQNVTHLITLMERYERQSVTPYNNVPNDVYEIFATAMDRIHIFVLLRLFEIADEDIFEVKKFLQKYIIKTSIIRCRLLDEKASDKTIGGLYPLPKDCLYEIASRV